MSLMHSAVDVNAILWRRNPRDKPQETFALAQNIRASQSFVASGGAGVLARDHLAHDYRTTSANFPLAIISAMRAKS